MLILYAILAACVIGGAAFVWHGIGASAVAKHEQAVKVEQDKVMAVAKAKVEAAANELANMQAAYLQGRAEREVVEKKVYVKAKEYVAAEPVFKLADCVVPQTGMDELNRARGQQAARILGLGDTPVSIMPSRAVTIEPKALPFPDPPVMPPREVTNPLVRPKPVPLK